jgi:HSP20 family protein
MTLRLIPWAHKHAPVRRYDYSSLANSPTDLAWSFRDVDQLVEKFLGLTPLGGSDTLGSQFLPSADLRETEKEFQFTLEVPGLDEKDIDISLSGNLLTVSGEKKNEHEETEKGYHRIERRYGSFSRSIRLPENGVDTQKAEASYKNGVLTISLPKTEDFKQTVKKIPLTTEKKEEKSEGDTSCCG